MMIDCIEKQQQQQNKQHYHTNQFIAPHLDSQIVANDHSSLLNNALPTTQRGQRMLIDIGNSLSSNSQQPLPTSSGANNELIGYYFGSISRETAEWILKTQANQVNGAYLLRSSGPNDDFVLSLMVVHENQINGQQQALSQTNPSISSANVVEVLHYKIVETEDSFVALHGQVGDEKFATIDELIERAQGVATKPRWPVIRQTLESQILPPTYWGLTVDQVRLAILIKAKQWGFPLLSTLFQQTAPQQQQQQQILQEQMALNSPTAFNSPSTLVPGSNVPEQSQANGTTLNNETIRTLIYKSLHEFQPWFHGKISREEAEHRIEDGPPRDGRFLVRERDNYSYAMCISHKKTTKHYRIDVLPTGELAIQDGRKFTSLMALVSHYTIMSDGLWCALTEACPRPIQARASFAQDNNGLLINSGLQSTTLRYQPFNVPIQQQQQGLYCVPPNNMLISGNNNEQAHNSMYNAKNQSSNLICSGRADGPVESIKAPIKEWLQTINHKWSQLMNAKNQHQSLNSFLFGSQNPLNNHCRHNHRNQHHHHQSNLHTRSHTRKCKNGHTSCACIQRLVAMNRVPSDQLGKMNGQLQLTMGNHHHQQQQQQQQTRATNCSCCSSLPNAMSNRLMKANNMEGNPSVLYNGCGSQDQQMTSTLLSSLPQNSGFTLSSQSFIGSPLFAVKSLTTQATTTQMDTNNRSAGGSSGSGGSGSQHNRCPNNVEEEKLISPAQSISANLNSQNPYNLNTGDIYSSSETSTAIVNDLQAVQTSSSSSSGNQRSLILANAFNSTQYGNKLSNNNNNNNKTQSKNSQLPNNGTTANNNQKLMHAGPILCGRHIGPAYRYTNCSEEKSCLHSRPLASYRAADDSQLVMPSTQLAGPAALAKFVQFQDGQCLRTHRDTQSIQMAYLSAQRQFAPQQQHQINASMNHRVTDKAYKNRVPFQPNVNGANVPQLQTAGGNHNNGQLYLNKNNANVNCDTMVNLNGTSQAITKRQQELESHSRLQYLQQLHYQQNQNQHHHHHHLQHHDHSGSSRQNQGQAAKLDNSNPNAHNDCLDVDLMDCGDDGGVDIGAAFEFKYDPKLIKSSSIETLCGIEDENDNVEKNLGNYKTNTELLMSLQSCWNQSTAHASNVLNPIPYNPMEDFSSFQQSNATDGRQITLNNNNNNQENELCQQQQSNGFSENNNNGETASSLLNSLIVQDPASHHMVDKSLDTMKKKHDLDELTTALLAQLTADLKAQVDLKNKQAGLGLHDQTSKAGEGYSCTINHTQQGGHYMNENTFIRESHQQQQQPQQQQPPPNYETNPRELVTEFDSLTVNSSDNR